MLVRHGPSTSNAVRGFMGWADVHLTSRGADRA
ncbi:histidine phosphatase family protein [Streptomyces sp. NPDC005283]